MICDTALDWKVYAIVLLTSYQKYLEKTDDEAVERTTCGMVMVMELAKEYLELVEQGKLSPQDSLLSEEEAVVAREKVATVKALVVASHPEKFAEGEDGTIHLTGESNEI